MNLKKAFRHYILGIIQPPELVPVKFKLKDMLFYVRFVKPYWKLALAGVLLTLLTTGISSIFPLGGKVLIDNVLLKKDASDILRILNTLGLQSLGPFLERVLGS